MVDEDKFVFEYPNGIDQYLGGSPVSDYLTAYLQGIGAQTYVVEKEYVDRDYLVDYQKFYSRAFENHKRFTTRLHFFKNKFSEKEFKSSIKNGSAELQNDYLGFVVIKPIKGPHKKWLIGRTLLRTYPKKDNQKERVFIGNKYSSSLFGLQLGIHTLPFQEQDRGVSACATISLWTCLFPLRNFFNTPTQSPAEITEISTLFPAPYRRFPSVGLTLEQILNYIGTIGLESEIYRYPEEDKIPIFIKAYTTETNMPILAVLELHQNNNSSPDNHAVVISGYKQNKNREIEELYVHDDQIGPYSRVKPVDGSFVLWDNEWIRNYNYERVMLKYLIVPIYEKIRLTFTEISAIFDEYVETYRDKYPEIKWELFLSYVQKYKQFLISQNIEDKWQILSHPMPKYMWIIRGYKNDDMIIDVVYDATAVHPKELMTIKFL